MRLADTDHEKEFRARVRTFLAQALPTLDWPEPAAMEDKLPFWRNWQRQVFAADLAGLTWDPAFGGQGLDERMRGIFAEECDAAGAPERVNIVGEDFAGPTIAHFGTEEQRERFLPAILSGEDVWCQLFSEPESGSDLASLRTRAERVDGGYRLTGQKIWTSRAQIAAHAILLARTGGGDRHRGITYFLLPMDSDGLTVRPLRHMLGEAEFNEVFLDDVFVPEELVVGGVDGGWKVAMGTLAFERVAIATGRVNTTRAVARIVEHVRSAAGEDGTALADQPAIRRQVARLWARAFVHRAIGQRVISGVTAGEPPGPVTSIGKLYFCPLVDDLADFRLSLEPLGGQVTDLDDLGDARAWVQLAYQSRGTAIAGGSTFIQRNIVAERILGMPRG